MLSLVFANGCRGPVMRETIRKAGEVRLKPEHDREPWAGKRRSKAGRRMKKQPSREP